RSCCGPPIVHCPAGQATQPATKALHGSLPPLGLRMGVAHLPTCPQARPITRRVARSAGSRAQPLSPAARSPGARDCMYLKLGITERLDFLAI
ncbi:hypothetical protein T492DRAFT_995824, partial [Pavlovales sp. CCMP2436]